MRDHDGIDRTKYTAGQLVKLSDPFNGAERDARYIVVEDRDDCVLIELVCKLPIRPTECLYKGHVEPA